MSNQVRSTRILGRTTCNSQASKANEISPRLSLPKSFSFACFGAGPTPEISLFSISSGGNERRFSNLPEYEGRRIPSYEFSVVPIRRFSSASPKKVLNFLLCHACEFRMVELIRRRLAGSSLRKGRRRLIGGATSKGKYQSCDKRYFHSFIFRLWRRFQFHAEP